MSKGGRKEGGMGRGVEVVFESVARKSVKGISVACSHKCM